MKTCQSSDDMEASQECSEVNIKPEYNGPFEVSSAAISQKKKKVV